VKLLITDLNLRIENQELWIWITILTLASASEKDEFFKTFFVHKCVRNFKFVDFEVLCVIMNSFPDPDPT